MARWEESQRARTELLAAFEEAEADLGTGRQYADYTETTLPQLTQELKREARLERDRQSG